MSEVFPTEEMLRAQRLMADMPDQIQNFFNSDVRKLFATIDHWKQRAEQAHNEGKNAALKEIARWLGHDTATFGSVRKWIDELRLRAEQAEADRKVLGGLLVRSRFYVEADAQMMADITRHAPLDQKSQAKHDSTEYPSEVLLRDITAASAALGRAK